MLNFRRLVRSKSEERPIRPLVPKKSVTILKPNVSKVSEANDTSQLSYNEKKDFNFAIEVFGVPLVKVHQLSCNIQFIRFKSNSNSYFRKFWTNNLL